MIFMSPASGITQDEPATTTYGPADRTAIEFLVDEEWRSGQLRDLVERAAVIP